MFVNEVNDVKIYNLSAGKSVPDVSQHIYQFTSACPNLCLFKVAHRSAQALEANEECGLPAPD